MTHEVLFSDHVCCSRGIPAPTRLRANREIRSGKLCYKVNFIFCSIEVEIVNSNGFVGYPTDEMEQAGFYLMMGGLKRDPWLKSVDASNIRRPLKSG